MSATKFKIGQSVLHKGDVHEVQMAKRDFARRIHTYRLKGLAHLVDEREITAVTSGNVNKTPIKGDKEVAIELKRAEYLKEIGKDVPSNKKNNIEWMTLKISEEIASRGTVPNKDQSDEDEDEEVTELDWEALTALDAEATDALCVSREMDIDPNDYDELDDLHMAIAEELDIEVTISE